MDSGREGWTDFDSLHRGSPHAAEMIAAEREHRVALTTKVEKVNVKKTEKRDEKPPCTTWNDYEEEGSLVWADGSLNKYRNFVPGEPNNMGDEDGMALCWTFEGKWVDFSNDAPLPCFLCEKSRAAQ